MKLKIILVGVVGLLVGLSFSYIVRESKADDESIGYPVYGGNFDCSFRASIVLDETNAIKGVDIKVSEGTIKWIFKNLTKEVVSFSIPIQKYHVVSKRFRSFNDLPKELSVVEPINLAPGEEISLEYETSYFTEGEFNEGDIAFEVIAKIGAKLHILVCAATVEKK